MIVKIQRICQLVYDVIWPLFEHALAAFSTKKKTLVTLGLTDARQFFRNQQYEGMWIQ